jgi:hypothetical protein
MTVLSNKLIQQADRYIEANHEAFCKLGGRFFEVFGYEKNRISTQIRNLQQITCSATRFADIEDFVKNQMGKEKTDSQPKWKVLGKDVLDALQQLREESQQLASDDAANQMAFRLRLARGWVRAVVGEYLYRVACDQIEAAS